MKLPLVLIPGFMCDARLFAPQIYGLSDYMVAVSQTTQHASISKIAAEVLASAPNKFALAGLSMGGIIAMEIVKQAPDRVLRLALMDTNPLAESKKVQLMRDRQIAKVRRGKLLEVMKDELKPRYLIQGQEAHKIKQLCIDMALALGEAVFISQSYALQTRVDQCATLANYHGKTLILHGVDDMLCPLERHQLMHRLLPHAKYLAVKNAGHLPTLEAPQVTTKALYGWLSD